MEFTLIWYNLYTKKIKYLGFVIKPYDICIANSGIYYNQDAIAWYFNDNNVSHIEERVNTKIIDKIAEHFGKLIVSQEKKHKLLGMGIEFLEILKVYFFMK